ncbi:MAG: type III secretion protein [Phycisphaerales bacterium]|nr:MAG: type III secretion protein [Phycisphaerales bacterium]
MLSIEPILDHAIPFTLVLFRLAGLFVFAPVLSSVSIPFQVRTMLAFMLALGVYPLVPASMQTPPELDLFVLLPIVACELMIGAVLGMLVSLPIMAMQLAGYVAGYQMGLSLASAYNPELDTSADISGQLLFYLATASWLAIGGLDMLFYAVVLTFEHLPAGGYDALSPPLELYLGLLSSSMELGLRVAAPVTGMLLLVMIVMGFVMKTMPQINVLSVGFPLKIMVGLSTLLWSIFIIEEVAGEEIAEASRTILQYASGLRPRGGE